jgi:hypothetical protein
MRAVTATPANMIPSAASMVAEDAPVDSKNLSDAALVTSATQTEANLGASRNQAAKISSTSTPLTTNISTPSPSTSAPSTSTPSKGAWGWVDKFLGPLERVSSDIQAKYGKIIEKVVQGGNEGSLLANALSLGEPVVPVTGPIGDGATKFNLVTTGLQGFLAGVKEKDITYAVFKLADALMFMVPRELQFGMRLGPSGYNLALATRQQNNIKGYGTFSEGIKKNLEQVGDYIKGLGKFGLIDGYKPENADKSKVFAVGGPLQGLIGSTGMILSYLPFMPQAIKNVLKPAGYLSRFAGAIAIDFSEIMSKQAQSQFSGAAKIDFLAGDISDLLNKVVKITKHTLVKNMKMPENSMPVRIATVLQSLFKNFTQAAGSLGRVVSARGVELGLTEEKYKTVGFRGFLSKWMASHMDALLGGRAAAANNVVPAQLSVEAKLKAAGAADKAVVSSSSSSNSKVSSRSYSSSSLREVYSDYSSSSRGAAAAGETRNNALVDKVLEGALNDKDISSSTQDAITLSNINSSTQDAITLSNINSSTQDAVTLSNINSSTQNETDTAFSKSA